jgi:excinuclease UvrABC nuclease subunit
MSLNVHNIKTIETANELDALLLESRLVKELCCLFIIANCDVLANTLLYLKK